MKRRRTSKPHSNWPGTPTMQPWWIKRSKRFAISPPPGVYDPNKPPIRWEPCRATPKQEHLQYDKSLRNWKSTCPMATRPRKRTAKIRSGDGL